MRVAAISDIHSNLDALQAVLEAVDRAGVDSIVCAGDIVGYGPFPNECCGEVLDRAAETVMGNHDLSALTKDVAGMNPYAAAAAHWTAGALEPASYEFLRGLGGHARFEIGGRSFAIFHGSPRDPVEYVFEEDLRDDLVRGVEEDLLILGHTHVPFVRKVGGIVVVNPGSVGQPRDGDPRASFAVIDTDGPDVRIVRTEYDVQSAIDAIIGRGLPRMLGERLTVGR